jgi:hypothetical protein
LGRSSTDDRPRTAPVPVDDGLPPSRARGREVTYGWMVAGLLAVVSILNLTVTSGKGAPAHPQTGLAVAGLIASLVTAATIPARNRLLSPIVAVVAAYLTVMVRTPTSLDGSHILALVLPVVYAILLTQRHRKSQIAANGGRRLTAADRRAASEAKREERQREKSSRSKSGTSGPTANRRYTPPKAKRPTAPSRPDPRRR